MKKFTIIILSILLVGLFQSCQTEIEVDLPDYDSKLVIEGTIETGQPALVTLSKSVPYFSKLSLQFLMDSVLVTDAIVTVTSETGESEQLTLQYCADAPMYMAFRGKNLIGKENTKYTLKVECQGKTYTAETTIPKTFDLDSIWFDHSSELLSDTSATIRVLLTDDGSAANYYAFSVKVQCPTLHDRLWVSTLPLAFDDRTFNGQTFNYEIMRASPSTFLMPSLDKDEQREFGRIIFRPGDTVYVRRSTIDYATYKFMLTGGTEVAYGSNPFTNPAPVASNIMGEDVLGSWCGFASKVDTLIWKQ